MKVIFSGESTDIRNCPEHSHSEFEIIITLRGEAQTYIGNKAIDVCEGSVAVLAFLSFLACRKMSKKYANIVA